MPTSILVKCHSKDVSRCAQHPRAGLHGPCGHLCCLHPWAVVLAEVGSYPECGRHDEARVCACLLAQPAPILHGHSPTPTPGMSAVGCALRPVSLGEKYGTPVIKSTPPPNTPSGCKFRPAGHLVWDLVWTCAQLFLSLCHLPLAVPSRLPQQDL